MSKYKEPTSRAEAESRRMELATTIEDIQGQLGNMNRTNEYGMRLNEVDYAEWRRRATVALRLAMDDLRRTNAWLKAHPPLTSYAPANGRPAFDAGDPTSLILASWVLMRERKWEGLDEYEQRLRNALQNYLEHAERTVNRAGK